MNRFVRLRYLIIKRFKRVIKEKTLIFILDLALKALDSRFIRLELNFFKKLKKSLRVSIIRANFKKD